MLLQSDAKEESIEALNYVIAQCNAISSEKTKFVHLSRSDIEAVELPQEVVQEKKGKKSGKQQSATFATLLQHWLKKDEIEGLKKKQEEAKLIVSDALSVASGSTSSSHFNEGTLVVGGSVKSGRGGGLASSGVSPIKKKLLKVDGPPDMVYVLSDFPTSIDDAEQLLKIDGTACLLDGVLQFVWRPGSNIEPPIDKGKVVLGGILPQVAAFNKLPHLEQARQAAVASRASTAKKQHNSHHSSSHHTTHLPSSNASHASSSHNSSIGHHSSAAHTLATAMHHENNDDTSILDEMDGRSLADDSHNNQEETTSHLANSKYGGNGLDGTSASTVKDGDVAGLETRRKSFELPMPQSKKVPVVTKKETKSSHHHSKASNQAEAGNGMQEALTSLKPSNVFVEKLIESVEKNSGVEAWADLSFDEV